MNQDYNNFMTNKSRALSDKKANDDSCSSLWELFTRNSNRILNKAKLTALIQRKGFYLFGLIDALGCRDGDTKNKYDVSISYVGDDDMLLASVIDNATMIKKDIMLSREEVLVLKLAIRDNYGTINLLNRVDSIRHLINKNLLTISSEGLLEVNEVGAEIAIKFLL